MIESLVEKLSDLGYHFLIEVTLRTFDVPKKTAELLEGKGYEVLEGKGYEVQVALIATKPELSYLALLSDTKNYTLLIQIKHAQDQKNLMISL